MTQACRREFGGIRGTALTLSRAVARQCDRVRIAWTDFTYRQTLDPARFERAGLDTNDPRFDPRRIGKPSQSANGNPGYDFPQLEATRARLAGIDRPRALKALFDTITQGSACDVDRHLRVLRFLQKSLRHELLQPIGRDGMAEFDPLVLLELSEARCGQAARVAVDLFQAAGYAGRLVQAHAHVLAEIYYGGGWHYFDADLFGNGDSVQRADGSIPSMAELARTPYAIDALTSNWDPMFGNGLVRAHATYPSYFLFARRAYTTPPCVYTKRQDVAPDEPDLCYGWNHWITTPDPDRFPPEPVREYMIPAGPVLDELTLSGRHVSLGWAGTYQPPGLVLGYRVMVSHRSRGWGYGGDSVAPALTPYKSHTEGWLPEWYEARYRVPPAEVALFTVTEPHAAFTLPDDGDFYVTVMPFDAHGEAVGRKVFPMSEELKISGRSVHTPAPRTDRR